MNILGISNDETSSAVIFQDSRLVAAASEERFSRKKLDKSFPHQSIGYVLKEAGLKKSEIDIVSYAWSKGFQENALFSQFERVSKLKTRVEKEIFFERVSVEQTRAFPKREEFWNTVKNDSGFSNCVVEDFYHHEAHAFSACMMSQHNECAVLTCDGRGDYESLTFSVYSREKNILEKLYSSTSSDSLGFFYGRITGLLGFTPHRHEGKITGLAAYGDPDTAAELMKKMINYDGKDIHAVLGDFYRPFYTNYSDTLQNEIRSFSREDVAAAAQAHLEDILSSFVRDQYARHKLSGLPLCLAGGVFGNVKVNAKLRDTEGVSGIFVQPQMGDGGLAIGAACGSLNKRGIHPGALINMSLGPLGGDVDNLISSFSDRGYTFIKYDPDDLIPVIIENLMTENVVGLVRGRMEFGPRALCNRSIIYKTSDTSCNDWLNKRMSRTEFMPFAPVMTEENARIHLRPFDEKDSSLWFMTATVAVSNEFKEKSPAVTHVDQTARPQVVSRDRDLWLWNLLNKWEEVSGEPSLINTSFNIHEEPIVCTYEEAFSNLENEIVDALVLDNWLVTKSGSV